MNIIKVKELRALRGPNRYSRKAVIIMVLDIKDYEEKPSDKIKGFTDRLVELIPSLQGHGCSIGGPGGFIQRLRNGTWAGHIIEHIALELQCLAGMEVGFGKTFTNSRKGVYIVVFEYKVESVGLKAAKDALALFESVATERIFDLKKSLNALKVLREDDMLGPSTWSIVKEAKSRDIPYIRLDNDSYIQLGYGVYQKRIQATITSQTSAIAVDIADGKTEVKEFLKKSGIPVPKGGVAFTLEEAIAIYEEIGTPVVVKPNVGNHGNGSTLNVINLDQLKDAFHVAKVRHERVIIEENVYGHDFRLLVIDGKMVAAARREPAHVVGDGKSTILDLIKKTNEDPRRGFGHEKNLTRIDIDRMTKRLLVLRGYSLDSCPELGERVYLKATANLSQGGTATDVTNEVSPDIRLMAERTARIIGLDCAGVDVLASDISLSINKSGIKVVEINAAPGFRMHLQPTKGQHRNVAKPLVDMLFPKGYNQVPVMAVTGTNGKTTTCKLIAHTLKYSGKNVGLACTTGVEIDGYPILKGDYSGPSGTEIVLKEPSVDHVVLEVARGGILRRGLGIQAVDVGVILNIGCDHIGVDWVESQEELSLVKSTVVEVVKREGTSVLNADDDIVMSLLDRARGRIILFSTNPMNKRLNKHLKAGGTIVTVDKQVVVIRETGISTVVCALEKIPITFGGIVDFNIANALAAVATLYALNLSIEKIRNGLMTFYPSVNQNPGRMNLLDFLKYKVLIDYGHNPESARAMEKLLPRLSHGRKLGLFHGTGSRTDEQIIEYGRALAPIYDYIVLADFDPRERAFGETPALVRAGLIEQGFKAENIKIISGLDKALDFIFAKVESGDIIVIQPDEIEPIVSRVTERYQQLIQAKV